MPRRGRERDALPSIEVIGGARAEESVQEVEVGGDGRGGRWWRLALAVAVVGIGLIAVLGGGSDEDGERSASSSTTRSTVRRSTTSSTTTPLPPPTGPVLPVATGSSLLLTGPTGGWYLLELDTGAYRVVERRGSMDGPILPVSGGVAVADAVSSRYIPLLAEGEPVPLGDSELLLPSGRADRVWVGARSDEGPLSEIRLVDLRGRTLATRAYPSSHGAYAATSEGPVFADGGRTWVVTADAPRVLAVGEPVGSFGDRVAIRECREDGVCVVVLVHVHTGARQVVEAMRAAPGLQPYVSVRSTPDGDIVATEHRFDGAVHVRWFDPEGRLLAEGSGSTGGPEGFEFFGEPTFLPGRQGMLMPTGRREITWVRPSDGILHVDRFPIDLPLAVDRVVLIRP